MQALLQELQEFKRDNRWLEKHYDQLVKQYADQYVAVYREKVVDHDNNLQSLLKRLMKSYPDAADHIVVKYLTSQQFDMIL